MDDWQDEALCAETDPDLFHPHRDSPRIAALAKAICHRCDVEDACLEWALATGQEWGVWGGMDEGERRALRRPEAA